MDAKLIVVGGETKLTEIDLRLPAVIGRGHDASVPLTHPLVSRQHCEIYEQGGQLVVRDLGSLNGTFIGSKRVTEDVLPSGGLLTVGTVTFRAVYGDELNRPLEERRDKGLTEADDADATQRAPDAPVATDNIDIDEVEVLDDAEEVTEESAEGREPDAASDMDDVEIVD